jgi:ribose transport system permease protein
MCRAACLRAVFSSNKRQASTTWGISTIFLVFYTNSVSPSTLGNFYERYPIAATVLGGCSLRGGEASILGIVPGTALLQVLQNQVNILGIANSPNFAVMGMVILLGVLADQQLQKRREAAIAVAAAPRGRPAGSGAPVRGSGPAA